jgi:hypothetical protein
MIGPCDRSPASDSRKRPGQAGRLGPGDWLAKPAPAQGDGPGGATHHSVSAVKIHGLHRDLTTLSYDELFARYRGAVAAMREASAEDAKRIELEIVTPLNEELTRRSQSRLKR